MITTNCARTLRYGGLPSGRTRILLLAGTMALGVTGGLLRGGAAAAARRTKLDIRPLSDLMTSVSDVEATIHVTKFEATEAEKIGQDFKRTYALRNVTLQYKQPNKLRIDGRSAIFGSAILILNGATRFYSVPKLRIHKLEDLENSPGKRQSMLEYSGVISPDTLQYMKGSFVREEKVDGQPALVYNLNYSGMEGGSHYRLWVDPRTHITVKREWFDATNNLRATFFYLDPLEISPGIWLPTRLDVKNAGGITAVSSAYSDFKVNQGLTDNLFSASQ